MSSVDSGSFHSHSLPSQYMTVGGVGGGGGGAGSCFCEPSAPFGPNFGSAGGGSGIENPHFTHNDFGSNAGSSSKVTLHKIDTNERRIDPEGAPVRQVHPQGTATTTDRDGARRTQPRLSPGERPASP